MTLYKQYVQGGGGRKRRSRKRRKPPTNLHGDLAPDRLCLLQAPLATAIHREPLGCLRHPHHLSQRRPLMDGTGLGFQSNFEK